ncbi:DUF637 domain-containing protein [Pectobacterium zantedeschiae]|uniref:Filamentous hemagglutinin N-terminal domain-containing protein n=1 Tax=Pectobacterium zantedeschiae TaxID=2034769 RepID=A0A9X8JFT9_9GAMM|nr:DUF637 domain-containing protein [Pectobacterium zantedeschiae]RYC40191.1 hemagglutinin [Pectobacterium zantedeschiae]RYC40720.1 filamentous hemagglutinin N-terminal domain-containing protein [Pectobacterium zantedeschiae]
MEKFNNRATRGLSYVLIYLTAIQPLHPAFAALTPDGPRTQVNNAGAVPVINIATPNAAGVSHNTYQDFSVGTPGAVLNNSIAAGQSQLAGQVNANANLNGKAAELIINEVTGSTRSDLQGKVEVFGSKANVLIANPNGITCDGCGFINTPSATLTTGKPVLDQQGALETLEVKKGSITIGGKGLDGSATDYVDILSRATELNGKINAKSLTLTQGSNRVDFKTGTIAPIAGEDTKPLLAVDTKALGGMYAERIRLVATEDGVGANVANLTSSQQGITLDSKGKIQLGNVHAKTDLNLTAQQVDIAAGNTVKSDRDITLASTVLNNRGNIIAGEDMRLFNDSLTNTQATIEANNNLWIQKDAAGKKGVKVENRSGTIKTNTGDLVIRTEQLDNVRDKLTIKREEMVPTSTSIKSAEESIDTAYKPYFKGEENKKWFGDAIDYNDVLAINEGKIQYEVSNNSPEAIILSGSNIYINAAQLHNDASQLSASKSAVLTGERFTSVSYQLGIMDIDSEYIFDGGENLLNPIPMPNFFEPNRKDPSWMKKMESFYNWRESLPLSSHITAGSDLVVDFIDTLSFDKKAPYDIKTPDTVFTITSQPAITAKNIVLNGKNIFINDTLQATGNITAIAEENISISDAKLQAEKNLSAIAGNNISAFQGSFISQNAMLTSRTGDITIHSQPKDENYLTGLYYTQKKRQKFSKLSASDNLEINSGGNIHLSDIEITQSKNIAITANKDILFIHSENLLQQSPDLSPSSEERQPLYNDALLRTSEVNATNDILMNAGGTLLLQGKRLNAGKDISLSGALDVIINPKSKTKGYDLDFLPSRAPESVSQLYSGNNLQISAGRDIEAQGMKINSKGRATLAAGRDFTLPALAYSFIDDLNDNNKDDRQSVASLHTDKELTISANGTLIATGTDFSSGGDMTLSSGGKMEFNAVANHVYREGTNEYSESVTQKNAVLNSGGILTLLSNGSILFQATQLIAKGALDAAAKGGFLYAQAAEESSHYEKTTTTRKWYGKKTTIRQTSHNVTNKVTEFTADGDINLLSRDDSTYEASKINAGKNAKLTSTQGSINFKAVKDTAFEQTITTSKGFFIKSNDKGYTKDTWLLPSIYSGGQLTIDAATGITADAKNQNAQSLQNALLVLSNNPGTAWLKDLNSRTDVQWSTVQDAYSTWNHTTQSLNPVVGAVIAIAVAAVTAGTGLAAAAGQLAAGAVGTGASATTIAVVNGAAYSGMTALTSQAAVALVDNKGNLSKTFQAMSSSDSVKSLVTSMVIGGALAGFDEVMQFSQATNGTTVIDPAKAKLPMLSNGDWSKVAQRVAGQSVINSSIGTAINGGSFKDNFTTALLSNIGSQINAEGAKFIGDKGEVLGLPIDDPRRVISHAVIAGVAAEIGGGNAKGAAAGALAAELAAISLGNTFVDPALREIQITSTGRIIGALAGAAITGKASGVNSGANAAESVLLYNFLMHDEPARMAKKLADCKGNGECEVDIRKEITRLSAQNENKFESCRVAGNGDCINEMLSGISEASGFRELGLQIGFDIAGQYQQMGENAYDRFDTCGWNVGTGCALKLWGKEAVTEAVLLGAGWGVAKFAGPAIGKYLTEVGILSQKGALANIKSAQVGLKDPAYVDTLKNQMKNNSFNFSNMENRVGGYVDKNGKYYLLEGNHRMVAAKELYQETGNSLYIENLIKNGKWTYTEKYTSDVYSLPVRKK